MSYLLGSDAVRSQEQRKRTNLKVNAAGGCSSASGILSEADNASKRWRDENPSSRLEL